MFEGKLKLLVLSIDVAGSDAKAKPPTNLQKIDPFFKATVEKKTPKNILNPISPGCFLICLTFWDEDS